MFSECIRDLLMVIWKSPQHMVVIAKFVVTSSDSAYRCPCH